MAEYIEREAALHRMKVEVKPPFAVVRDMPAADVVEVRHGEWRSITDYGNGNCFGYCSACGTPQKAENATALKLFFKYCRNCGAKMDGKGESE